MPQIVQQRTNTDCVICCLAMLTARRYEDVRQAVGDVYCPERGLRDEGAALERLGFSSAFKNGHAVGDFVCRYRGPLSPEFFREFAWKRRALLSVPSLNFEGQWHMVYFDGTDVFDPSSLKTYSKFTDLRPDYITLFSETKPCA